METVIADGAVVYEDGLFPGHDHDAVVREIQEQLSGPAPEAVRRRRQAYRELEPHLRRFYADWNLEATALYNYHSIH